MYNHHFFAFFVLFTIVSSEIITLPDKNNCSLGEYICDQSQTLKSNTTFILQSNITHTISPTTNTNTTIGSVCVISNLSDISIVSSDTNPVTVKCTGTYLATRRGFVFHNVSGLVIKGINFEGCGGILDDRVSFLNDSRTIMGPVKQSFYFGICHSSALAIHYCSDVSLSNILVDKYQGFGMMILDSYGVTELENITVDEHVIVFDAPSYCYPSINSGSGLLVYYHASKSLAPAHEVADGIVSVTNCAITGGYTNNNNASLVSTISSFFSSPRNQNFPIPSAGGLTVIIREGHSYNVSISFDGLYITNNTGLQAGGALILYVDVCFSNVKLSNVIMSDNCIIDPVSHYNFLGRSLMVYFLSVEQFLFPFDPDLSLILDNAVIGNVSSLSQCKNIESHLGSYTDVLIRQTSSNGLSYAIILNNVTFLPMNGFPNRDAASALYAGTTNGVNYATGLQIQLINITASNFTCLVSNNICSCVNFGVMAFAQVSNVSIVGGRFSHIAGSSVLYAKYSRIYLSGNPIFSENDAETYGALSLMERTYLFFVEPLHAVFKHNRALLGAAIYGVEENVVNCVIQYLPAQYYDISNYTDMDIKLEMDNNRAELAGNVLYGSPIKHCEVFSPNLSPELDITRLINSTFILKGDRSDSRNIQDISSTPSLVCSCNSTPPAPCTKNITSVNATAHPGQKINISIAAFDIDQKVSVYSLVTAQFYSHGIKGVTSLYLDPQGVITRIQPGVCTNLFYTIFHSIDNLTHYPIHNVQLDVGPYTETPRFVINITLLPCPDGFQSVNSSCVCVYEKSPFNLSCNGQMGYVNHPPNSWIGRTELGCMNRTSRCYFGYSNECPPSYCLPLKTTVGLSDADGICYGNRTGTLCGACPEGLSVVFGSAECQQCSNAYLSTILVYAIAGILLVFFLFLLDMTLATGTINGLIFYVNIIGSTDGYLFGHNVSLYYLKIFIALLNFELGFPFCFYHGMDEVALRCLQFAFPIYIWTLVIVIIILSRYSTRLAKITGKQSVAVLATLIYLSYSKITITIVNALTSAKVIAEDGNHYLVWYFCGDLKFGQGGHLLLMMLCLAMLCLFVIPFTLITTLSPFLTRFRIVNRYMPLTDAVFAPYKDKWRFWFGARLCLLVAAFIIAAILRGSDVKLFFGLQHVLVIAFSFVQAFINPFKNKLIALLDLSFMLNYSLIAFIGVYTEEQNMALRITSQILVSLALIVFIGIVVYHCYKTIKSYVSSKHQVSFPTSHEKEYSINNYGAVKPTKGQPATHSEIPEVYDYNEYREPLLSNRS